MKKNIVKSNNSMKTIIRLKDSVYYFKLFRKNKNKIRKLKQILSDDLSKKIVYMLIVARLSQRKDKYYFYRKIASPECTEHKYTLEDGYQVYESKNPYFLHEFFNLTKDMVFLDGGAYIGDTVLLLKRILGDECRFVYAFEPNAENYQKLKENAHIYGKAIQCYNVGLYDFEGTVSFCDNDAASCISEKGSNLITVINTNQFLIDLKDNKPTFIKLDIEGSEMVVINAIREYIRDNHPDLAISIYHNLEDLWEIPIKIYECNPSYRLYIRHQSNSFTETVLYASVTDPNTNNTI